MKELTIRREEHMVEIDFNKSQHLAKGTGGARFWWRFSYALQQALSLRTRRPLCRQGAVLVGTRQLRSQGPVSLYTHCTEGVTRSEGREGASGDGSGVRGAHEK